MPGMEEQRKLAGLSEAKPDRDESDYDKAVDRLVTLAHYLRKNPPAEDFKGKTARLLKGLRFLDDVVSEVVDENR